MQEFQAPTQDSRWADREKRRERLKQVPQSHFMESFVHDLQKVMHEIADTLRKYGISFTFIGGAARNMHGAFKITEDIDILVDRKDAGKLEDLPIGFIRRVSQKRFFWNDPKTLIEFIFSGEISGDGKRGLEYLRPSEVSEQIDGLPVMDLYDLICYKLTAGLYSSTDRSKDFAHIVDLIKANDLPRDYLDQDLRLKNEALLKYHYLWDSLQVKDPIDQDVSDLM
jgi:hypothetical protein